MELNEAKQRISQIVDVADRAIQACRADKEAPESLKESMASFGMELSSAVQTAQQARNEAELGLCIDGLEEAADEAKRQAQRASGISEKTRSTVLQAHDEIAQLKRQFH